MKETTIYQKVETASKEIWNLAKEKTELFLGVGGWIAPIGVAIAAVIIYCINWVVYCYEIGYYHMRYNVPISLIDEPQATKLSISVVLGIIFIVVMVATGIIGRWTYRKCRYGAFVLTTYISISAAFVAPLIPSLISIGIASVVATIITLLLLAGYLTGLFIIFSYFVFLPPTNEDKLARENGKLENLKKKIKKLSDNKKYKNKRTKYTEKKKTVEDKASELLKTVEAQAKEEKFTVGRKLKKVCVTLLSAVFVLLIVGLPASLTTGLNLAEQNKEFTLVLGQEDVSTQFAEFLPEDCKSNGLVIIYQNDDGVLVSPCYVENQTVSIYTNCQHFIKSENLSLCTNTYQQVRLMSVVPSFDEPDIGFVSEDN